MHQPENDTLLPLLSNIVARLGHCPFVATVQRQRIIGPFTPYLVIIVKYVVAFESRVVEFRYCARLVILFFLSREDPF